LSKPTQDLSTTDQIPEEILSSLPESIRNALQNGQFNATLDISKTSISSYRSNLPPVEFYESFERVFPGWGERLLEMTLRQGTHRQTNETKQVEGMERRMDRGQLFGFSIAASAILAAATIVVFGPSTWATSIAALGLVIVGVGGPSVARIMASKFKLPNPKDGI
jgi:uncharacterized membrane protein